MSATSQPHAEKFAPRDLGPRDWGQEILIAHTEHYIGKLLFMRAGTAGGLQYHTEKDETFFLYRGTAYVDLDPGDGTLVAHSMLADEAYHIPPGVVHRVRAITDCVFFETSTPHFDDRMRMEEVYGEPAVGGLPSTR